MSRIHTVVWRDAQGQLKCTGRERGLTSTVRTWIRGGLSNYHQDSSALLQCEQTWQRRQEATEALLRSFWQRLTGSTKTRPASASQAQRNIETMWTRSTKVTLSPGAMRSRGNFAKYADQYNTASTPVLARQVLPLFPDASYYGPKTPCERMKSSRKLITRAAKSPVPPVVRNVSEQRLLPSLGAVWQQAAVFPSKPGKRIVRKRKSQSKLAERLRVTPYKNV